MFKNVHERSWMHSWNRCNFDKGCIESFVSTTDTKNRSLFNISFAYLMKYDKIIWFFDVQQPWIYVIEKTLRV